MTLRNLCQRTLCYCDYRSSLLLPTIPACPTPWTIHRRHLLFQRQSSLSDECITLRIISSQSPPLLAHRVTYHLLGMGHLQEESRGSHPRLLQPRSKTMELIPGHWRTPSITWISQAPANAHGESPLVRLLPTTSLA